MANNSAGTVELYTFERFALSALLYLLGVAAYVSRVPERLFPGKCDFWVLFSAFFCYIYFFGLLIN